MFELKRIVLVFVAGSLGFGWGLDAASAQEQRCTELGGACACSEPMAASEGGAVIRDFHNFSDSPPASECDRHQAYFGTDGTHRMVPVNTFGSAPYALDWTQDGYIWLRGKSNFSSADRVVCYRYYKQVDDLYSPAGNSGCENRSTQRNKVFQMSFSSTPVQVEDNSAGSCPALGSFTPIDIAVHGGTAEGRYAPSPRVDWNDCDTKPCRLEFCADGNLASGNNISFRLRITSLESGKVGVVTTPAANYGPPALPDFWGGDLYHSGPTGTSRIGYFIQTIWQTDQDQWPGPAVEVEGTGGGGGGGGGGSTAPPAAPVLLNP